MSDDTLPKEVGMGRLAIFVQETVVTPDGQYIPCIAEEGTHGYYKTNWYWGKDFNYAQCLAEEYNAKLGLTQQEALKIILGTM